VTEAFQNINSFKVYPNLNYSRNPNVGREFHHHQSLGEDFVKIPAGARKTFKQLLHAIRSLAAVLEIPLKCTNRLNTPAPTKFIRHYHLL
jgi:hypothetical protein